MKIAKHVKGGVVCFRQDGRAVTIGPGYMGPVPDRILEKYRQQGRFQIVEDPFLDRVTTDMKRGEALLRSGDGTSEPSPGQKPAGAEQNQSPPVNKGKYIARHRHHGKWGVTEVTTGKLVSELMPRDEAEAKTNEMNGVHPEGKS